MAAVRPRFAVGAALVVIGTLLRTMAGMPAPASAAVAHCPNIGKIKVASGTTKADHQQADCLDDLLSPALQATAHTDASDWAALQSVQSDYPSGPIPGIQVDGSFPDTSTTNTYHGWNHDSQFVLRFPDKWNGKLVVTGAPGVRKQFAVDRLISDFVLDRGYAFASTDKGNSGTDFEADGK